ncbi:MAG: hypothetical protein P0Y59_04950 [Candidatus Sphingomonas phytovorans]|nr:hypothetical protein [Sphingomonas sp.]WEK01045.1 MAG: hypothetical protein P0Y59_04950 [Sphingomonas sp.]
MKHALPFACLALLCGCAERSTTRYPSLLPRPVETTSLTEPEASPPATATPDAPTDAKLAAMKVTLDESANAFAPAADRAERAAVAAKGQPAGSEGWITAQSALAELDGYRATTSAVLTDIEDLAIARATAGEPDYPGIDSLRTAAEAQLQTQSARIAAIQAMLPET